jgi:hypothetical protein
MIKNIMITSLGIFQLIIEFSFFILILSTILMKPFFLLYSSCRIIGLEDSSFLTKVSLFVFTKIMFYLSLFVFTNLVVLIYYLILTDDLFFLVYIYLYTIDIYIYNPLGIPSNPLNLPWGRFR